MRQIDLIVIHCSATRCNRDFPVEALEACHRARGFNGIGYHYYITRDGQLHLTRSEAVPGAHAKHYNKNTSHCSTVCVLTILVRRLSVTVTFPGFRKRVRVLMYVKSTGYNFFCDPLLRPSLAPPV